MCIVARDFGVFALEVFWESLIMSRGILKIAAMDAHDPVCMFVSKVAFKSLLLFETDWAEMALVRWHLDQYRSSGRRMRGDK